MPEEGNTQQYAWSKPFLLFWILRPTDATDLPLVAPPRAVPTTSFDHRSDYATSFDHRQLPLDGSERFFFKFLEGVCERIVTVGLIRNVTLFTLTLSSHHGFGVPGALNSTGWRTLPYEHTWCCDQTCDCSPNWSITVFNDHASYYHISKLSKFYL